MRFLVLLAALSLASAPARADERYYTPTPGNQYITTTDKYLYVVWSVPKDLAPFRAIKSRDELEAFVARTALHLCKTHRAKDSTGTKSCKVQVVRLNSNDEYTKSAAGGFKTIATLVVTPLAKITDDLVGRSSALDLAALKPLFSRFSFVHEEIPLNGAP